jgi:hypothetical protein
MDPTRLAPQTKSQTEPKQQVTMFQPLAAYQAG